MYVSRAALRGAWTMLPWGYSKVKREEDDGRSCYNSAATAGAGSTAEHKARVRTMTAEMAAEAGFRRSSRSEDHGGARARTTPAVTADAIPPPVKTPRYDGKADWEAFHAQFELLARAGRWSTEVKALQLAMCLTGDALSSLLLLSPEQRNDYDALVGALQRRFGSCTAASLLRSELCSRQRRPGEPLRELANDIEGLVHRTYAHMPPDIQSELACDHFLQALLPADLRTQTLLAHPKSLLQALELATEREMLCAVALRTVPGNSPGVVAARGIELNTATPAWAEELTQLVRAATLQEDRSPRQNQRTCWGCGQPGHLIRQCPKLSTKQGKGAGTA